MRISDWSSDVCSSDLADADSVRRAIEAMSEQLAGHDVALSYRVDPELHRVIVEVVDRKDGSVLRQIPGEEAVRLARMMNSGQGRADCYRPRCEIRMTTITNAGVGSGLDLEKLISNLVTADKTPTQTRLTKNQHTLSTQLSAVGTFKAVLSNLQSKLDALKSGGSVATLSAASSDRQSVG